MSEPIPGVAVVPRRRFLNADRAMVDRFGDPFGPLELDSNSVSPFRRRNCARLAISSSKTVRLDRMRNVTSLPSFSRLARLDNVELDTMKGLTDLSPVAAAPAL